MEYTETNKLIAEFMGAEVKTYPTTWASGNAFIRYPELIGSSDMKMTEWNLKNLKYHTSWDWLMPVVEKIEEMGHSVFIGKTSSHYCNIMYGRSPNEQVDLMMRMNTETKAMGIEDTKLGAVYAAIVQFINWYNSKS